jgi:hypothetical protein
VAVSYRSSANTGHDQQASSLAVPVPSGAAITDLVVCILSRWETFSDPTLTVPTGFSPFGTEVASGDGNGKLLFFYKLLTQVDTGTYTFSWTSIMWAHVHALCFRGVKARGDPVGPYFTSVAGVFGTMPAVSLTVPFAPGLVWTCYNDTATIHSPPTGFNDVIDFDSGSSAYRIEVSSGTYTASGAAVSSTSPACIAYFALEPHPPTALTGAPLPAAIAFEGDLGYAGLGIKFTGASTDSASAAADLTVSGTHVILIGTPASAAVDATAALSVTAAGATTALDGALDEAVDATAALSRTQRFDGPVPVASSATAELDVSAAAVPVELNGIVPLVVDAAGVLGLEVPLDGSIAVVADATAELVRDTALDGLVPMCVDASGELDVTAALALDGLVDAAGSAEAALTVERALDGAVPLVVDSVASLAVPTFRPLAGQLALTSWADAELHMVGRAIAVSLGSSDDSAAVQSRPVRAALAPRSPRAVLEVHS